MNTIGALIGLIIAFIIGFFVNRKSNQTDAKVLDLTSKIKDNQDRAAQQKADADKKTQEYLDALKKYDPQFHNDDGDDSGHAT